MSTVLMSPIFCQYQQNIGRAKSAQKGVSTSLKSAYYYLLYKLNHYITGIGMA